MDSLYNLIIVDDEYIIRDGLSHFKWEKYGFSVAGSASDGSEALELMEMTPVHLVITDIKMPVMDGLELCGIIHKKYPNTKVIILTGYKEFEYAQQAIRTGVAEYLLKPVELSAIEEMITKIRLDLDNAFGMNRLIDTYEKQLKESLPLAAENFLRNLVHGVTTDLTEIEERSNNLEIYLNHCYFTCSVFQFSFAVPASPQPQPSLEYQALKERLHEFLASENSIYYFFDSDFKLVLIHNFDSESGSLSTYQYMEELVNRLHSHINDLITAYGVSAVYTGTGNIYNSITYVAVSYRQALQSLELRFFNDKSELFYAWKEKSIYKNCENYYPYEKEQVLMNILLAVKEEDILSALNDFWQNLDSSLKQINPEHFRNIVIQLLNMLERNLQKFNTHISEFIPGKLYYAEYISTLPTVISVKNNVADIFIKAVLHLNQLQNNSRSSSYHAVNQAIKYIENNYASNITLTEVAEKVFLNSSYLSLQFKKETGMNFVGYLKKVRIEKSIELLKRIELKAYEICSAVGYQDYKYFTEVFRDITGMTPLEYRQKIL